MNSHLAPWGHILRRTSNDSFRAARRLILVGESRQARADLDGAVRALNDALRLEPNSLYAWRMLGALHEGVARHAEAADTYRRVIALNQSDVVALNNLAYHMALRENRAAEALGLASRAATLSRGNATIEDTLGWIHHLMGNDQEGPYLARASRVLTENSEVQLHAATVFAAAGRLEEATRALDAAVRADPALTERADVQVIRRKVGR